MNKLFKSLFLFLIGFSQLTFIILKTIEFSSIFTYNHIYSKWYTVIPFSKIGVAIIVSISFVIVGIVSMIDVFREELKKEAKYIEDTEI